MKTTTPKATDIARSWHRIDAQGKVLGRLATGVAELLMGKRKPYFVRHMDCGDTVVVINAKGFVTTGKKDAQKLYSNYSGYPGGLKQTQLKTLKATKPEEVIYRAVAGMLPKNKLQDQMLTRLFIYAGDEHPYKDKFKSK